MSNIASEQDAINALTGANASEQASPDAPPQQEVPVQPDTFSNVDPASLPPELQPVYKSMQADYTRKTQEIAELRKLGDPQQVAQAMAFLNNLENDPNTQVQLYQALQSHLQAQGLTPAQADQVINDEMGGSDYAGNDFTEYGDDEFVDEYDPTVELNQRIQTLESRLAQQDAARLYASIENNLSSQEAAIRSQNPHYTNDDVNAIYKLAHATDGNLVAAREVFEQIRNSTLNNYVNAKGNVNTAGAPLPDGGLGQQPRKFESLDDPDLDRAAEAFLRNRGL
jgi:hypothetical protein